MGAAGVPLRKGPLRRRAMLGWSATFVACFALELAGVLGFYQRGLSFALVCQTVILIFVVIMTNLFFSWMPKDEHRQNWLLNLGFTLGIMFGLFGGQLGGYYFARWGDLAARIDHNKVSADASPLSLLNPGKITFDQGTDIRGLQMGGAQFTSTNRLENRYRWYACATPIVSAKTTDTINYWAITEGISPCSSPQHACGKGNSCYGYVLAGENKRASDAVDAAVKEHNLKVMPGSTFVSLNVLPSEYTQESLEKALACTLFPLALFPFFTLSIYYIICKYEGVYFQMFYGAQFPKHVQAGNEQAGFGGGFDGGFGGGKQI